MNHIDDKTESAVMGIGVSEGGNRAESAARAAVKSLPLKGARGIVMNFETGPDVSLAEMIRAVGVIREMAEENAQIAWEHTISEDMGDKMRVTVIKEN